MIKECLRAESATGHRGTSQLDRQIHENVEARRRKIGGYVGGCHLKAAKLLQNYHNLWPLDLVREAQKASELVSDFQFLKNRLKKVQFSRFPIERLERKLSRFFLCFL